MTNAERGSEQGEYREEQEQLFRFPEQEPEQAGGGNEQPDDEQGEPQGANRSQRGMMFLVAGEIDQVVEPVSGKCTEPDGEDGAIVDDAEEADAGSGGHARG